MLIKLHFYYMCQLKSNSEWLNEIEVTHCPLLKGYIINRDNVGQYIFPH